MIIDSLWTLVKIIKHFKYQAANIVFHYWSVNAEIRKWQAQYMRQNKELCGSFWRKHNIISRHVVKFVAAEHKFYYPVFFLSLRQHKHMMLFRFDCRRNGRYILNLSVQQKQSAFCW